MDMIVPRISRRAAPAEPPRLLVRCYAAIRDKRFLYLNVEEKNSLE